MPNQSPRQNKLSVLGIMSGTSLDAVDYVICEINATQVHWKRHWQVRFPARLRSRLVAAAQGLASSHELATLHHDLGRFYAEGLRKGWSKTSIDLVGLHGQTIYHHPASPAATFQLGEPAYLVEACGRPVVSNFRAADLAAAGQGAPLATLFHQVTFGLLGEHVCVNNLGGISNVTSINARRPGPPALLAFDTGPGILLIDLAMQHATKGRRRFDDRGQWAARGTPVEELLREWLKHPFLPRTPPKSTGREVFGESFFESALKVMARRRLKAEDILATFTEFTARSIALNYRLHLKAAPSRVILTGGGAANAFLVFRIRHHLSQWVPTIELLTSDQLGWPFPCVEPAAFALLAYRRIKGLPGNLPATTGATRAVLLGQLSEPL